MKLQCHMNYLANQELIYFIIMIKYIYEILWSMSDSEFKGAIYLHNNNETVVLKLLYWYRMYNTDVLAILHSKDTSCLFT